MTFRSAHLLPLVALVMLMASGPAFAQTTTDYDTDGDNYIEVSTHQQLNAIRWDLDGNGAIDTSATTTDTTAYNNAFPNRATTSSGRMGCASTCVGYELTADLDLDTSGSGGNTWTSDDEYWNGSNGWDPIGDSSNGYTGDFKGNGYTINNLFISRGSQYTGLFAWTSSASRIETLGITNANVRGANSTGILIGYSVGEIVACYVTGSVTGRDQTGGVTGYVRGSIHSSYSTASVTGTANVGGLVGFSFGSTITNSYSTGTVSGNSGVGGFIGWSQSNPTQSNTYWDTSTSGTTTGVGTVAGGTVPGSSTGVTGQTTANLQNPTYYTGIYANWNANLDGVTGNDFPWHFGTSSDYPTLTYGKPSDVDYDIDGDNYIDVSNLAQLNAIRYDLDGNGAQGTVADSNWAKYSKYAFHNAVSGMGCASTCTGYELMTNLDFDSDGDDDVDANDHGGAYWNSGAGWLPLGAYSGTFEGNNRTISNLFINRGSMHNAGLFSSVDGDVSGLGLLNVNVTGNHRVGGLGGGQGGGSTISSCYVTGRVSGAQFGVGGLVGRSYRTSGTNRIVSSYAIVSVRVPASVTTSGMAGGLVGWLTNQTEVVASYAMGSVFAGHSSAVGGGLVGQLSSGGSVTASYATGSVTGAGTKGGLVGSTAGTVTDSYWDTKTSGIADDSDNAAPEGKTPSELKSPTTYGTTANGDLYANWNANLDGQPGNDDPWNFGTATQYPALKYDGMDTAVQFAKQPVTVTLTLMPASISENGGTSIVTATLARSSSVATTITVRPVSGAYTVGSDSTITIAAGSTADATDTVVITAVNNTQDEPDRSVTVSAVAHNAQSGGSVNDATLTLEDDDSAPTATLAANPASISENGAVSTIRATLSNPSSAITTITVRPVSGAYTVGADSTIAIAAGNTANALDTVVITSVNNTQDEPNRSVTVSGVARNTQGAVSVTGVSLTLEDDDDAPEVTMAVSPASISEAGEVSTVTATLNRPSSSATTIAVSVTPVTPAVAGDYSLSTPNTLTVAAGQTTSTGSVTITTVNNQVATGNKTVTVSASAVDNSVGTGSVNDATLTISDDDVARVTLLLYPASIPETGQVSTITATLDRTATAPTTITVSATPVSPAVAGDFTLLTPTTLTIAASATTTTDSVTITSVNDTTDAPDKRVTVSATVTGGNMASLLSPVTLTITDDDAAPTVTLASDPASISEASGVSTIRATLSHKSSAITTITVRPVSGAYTVGSDATIAIAAGSTANATDTVVITAVNNTRDEPDRAVTVTGVASNTQGAGSVTGAALTLQDDDPAPDVTLSVSPQSFSENGGVARVSATLSHPSSAATTVTVTAVANVYTVGSANTIIIAANATTSTDGVTITAEDNDRDAEDNAQTVTGTMTNSQGTGSVTGASVTITDDDAPPMLSISSPSAVESNALTFRVTLNKASGKEITVAYADASTGSATSGTDYTALAAGTLTFSAGETSETLAVSVTDDAVDEPNETVAVTLSNAVNTTFDGGATSLTGTGTIIDNDGMPALSIGSPSAIEGATGATLSFRVYLSPAHTSQVTVAYADARTGSATAGTDYTAFAAGTLTFAIGATEQTLDVSVIDDSIDEPHETVAVRLSSAVNAIFDGGGATLTGMGTIIDDDAVMLRIDSPSVAEGAAGTTATLRFTVSLSSANASQVMVAYTDAGTGSATAGTDYVALAGGTLIFAPGETRKPIDISVIGDATVEPNETVVVMLSNAVNGALAVATGTGTITNDDQPPPDPGTEPEPEPEPDPNTVPTFTEAVDPQSYPQGNEIDPLTLPAAIDGNGDLTYSLTELPEGLTFDAETRTVSGTPTESVEKAIYTLTATDEDGDAAEVSFFLTISANLIPSFGDASVDAQAYMRKQAIDALTLPQASGGDAPLTYALTPDLPVGLKFDGETRVLSGTPTDAMDKTTYTLTATDSDGDPATLMFTLSVMTDPIPTFGDTTIAAQGYQHQAFDPLTLPQASGGDEPLTYALNPDPPLPEGLTFDGETLTVSGTPIKAMDEMTYTLTATDGNGDEARLMFTLEVPDLMPTFGDTTIAAQSYLVNQEIESLTLPQASSGDGMLVYILLPSLPDGLSFDPTTRILSGMPTKEKTLATYTLSALDTDGDVASLPFTLEVSLPSPDFDGDGTVNFADFLTFADKFGSRLGQERYDARCDLNGDGEIGFADFLIFAADFGG